MTGAQPGIFASGSPSHHFLEFDVVRDCDDAALRAAVALAQRDTEVLGTTLVFGFDSDARDRLFPHLRSIPIEPAHPIAGVAHGAPATQRSIWCWIQAAGPDMALDGVRAVVAALAPVAHVALDQAAFVYRDGRDLTGFIDGTENPDVAEAPHVALVDHGVGVGGSYVLTMRWVHDLASFASLSVAEQEAVIGRTKRDSRELDPVPPRAHIGRVVIEEDGEELEIFRRSVPFGDAFEQGLYFVAFSSDPTRFDKMLSRMFGTNGDGLYDQLTDFSAPTTNARWFAPAHHDLVDLRA